MDPLQLRSALGHYATGVAIVACAGSDGTMRGVTVNSFSAVSLDPALVLFSLQKSSPNLEFFKQATCFSINVLSCEQAELSHRFATPGAERWAQTDWSFGRNGAPLIDGTLAQFECALHETHEGGDHVIFVLSVHDVREAIDGEHPLLFWRGDYRRLSPEAA